MIWKLDILWERQVKYAAKELYRRTIRQQVEGSRSANQPGTNRSRNQPSDWINGSEYYWWRKAYGGWKIDQAQRLRELEQENARLKRLVADLSLDNAIMKEALRGK